MKTILGMVLGMALMSALSYRYGNDWYEQIQDVVYSAQQRGAAGPGQAGPLQVAATPLQAAAAPAEVPIVLPVRDNQLQQASAASQWRQVMTAADSLQAQAGFPWQDCFRRAAASYQLPEALLLAVARGESNFDPTARSARDAIGVMQIRWPVTARHLGIRQERQLYDPCTNVDAGARYLRELIERYDGDVHLALAAYNFGPARVQSGNVPSAASDYSAYIFEHLQAVLADQHAASADDDPATGSAQAQAGQLLLLRFNQTLRARAFLDYLRETSPDLTLSVAQAPRGDHGVYLTYHSAGERRQALDALASSGVLPAP
jgi:hypothetical protein